MATCWVAKIRCYIAVLMLVGPLVPAQTATKPLPAGTRYVPVVVMDSAGTPISGLQPSDFSIEVEGKAQPVTAVSEVKLAGAEWKPATSSANQFTNAEAARASKPVTVICFDAVHTLADEENDARTGVLDALRSAAANGSMVGLVILSDNGPELVHDYRVDPATFQEIMKQVDAGLHGKTKLPKVLPVTADGAPQDRQVQDEVARILAFAHAYASNAAAVGTSLKGNPDLFLQTMQVLAQYAGGASGRKAVLWIGSRVPFQIDTHNASFIPPQSVGGASTAGGYAVSGGHMSSMNTAAQKKMELAWERALQALNDNRVALYPIEVRPGTTAAAMTRTTMDTLASMTGGRVFWGVSHLDAALKEVAQADANYYLLAFTPPDTRPSWVGDVVKVDKKDLQVLAPSGFFRPDLAASRQTDFDNVFQVSVDATAVPFVVQIGSTDAAAGKKKLHFQYLMPGGSFEIDQSNGNAVTLDIAAAAFDSSGKVAGQSSTAVNTKLPDAAVEQIRANGTAIKAEMDLAPGSYNVRFAVRDDLTGKVGSIDAPVTVK